MSTSCRQMFVPHHIRIVQNGNNENSFIHDQGHQLTTKEIDSMSILKADYAPFRERSLTHEIFADNQHLSNYHNLPTLQSPALTVESENYRTAIGELEERFNSKISSSMCDSRAQQNNKSAPPAGIRPLTEDQRLTLLERQVTRLNTRIYRLEDDFEAAQYWQKVIIGIGVVLTCIIALKNILNR